MIFNGQSQHRHPKPGTVEYEQHIREEIEHYAEIFKEGEGKETLLQPVPPSWREAESRAALLVRDATGDNLDGHLFKRLNRQPGIRMLSLGSGPGGLEIYFAQRAPLASIVGLDINDQLLELARHRARELNLTIRFDQADLNTVELPENEFDIVFCHASLHHVIELEWLAKQIYRTLRPGGELITVDVVTRNGYLMWPETREVVQALWKTLPERFRINHTSYKEARIDDEIVDVDQSESGMECVRSQDILATLEQAFTVVFYVPYFSIARRFFDTMYGPNYDLSLSLDRAVFDWIWELDRHYLASGKLLPETYFGIYRKTAVGTIGRSETFMRLAERHRDTRPPSNEGRTIPASSLEVYPNPVRSIDESGVGIARLTWSAAEAEEIEIRIGLPDGALFTRSGPSGAKATGSWVVDGTVFYLQNVTAGLPLTADNTLATVEVKVESTGSKKSPAMLSHLV